MPPLLPKKRVKRSQDDLEEVKVAKGNNRNSSEIHPMNVDDLMRVGLTWTGRKPKKQQDSAPHK
jgi:hypothetical protein